jgi:hypothetical protein
VTTADELELLDRQMALVADGDRAAVGPFFRALWPAVHAYCERALGAGADADDAAAQSMEKVFREASRYDRALFETLSPADRETLEQTFTEEVEGRSGASGPTLRKRRERALRRLREAWRLLYGR